MAERTTVKLDKAFINMSLHSDISGQRMTRSASTHGGLGRLFCTLESCQERLTTLKRRLPECQGGSGVRVAAQVPVEPWGMLRPPPELTLHVCKRMRPHPVTL